MEPADNLVAMPSAECASVDRAGSLDIKTAGSQLILYTGQGALQRSRSYALGIGVLTLIAGLALMWFSAWGVTVIAFGLILTTVVPRLIRAAKLLEIDKEQRQLTVVQSVVGVDRTLALDTILGIRGVYETKGWDGYSVMYAVGADHSETPIMVLTGTDERFAETVCRTLGSLLEIPATYAGPFGNFSTCFTPEQTA